jgi:hypothetical protein
MNSKRLNSFVLIILFSTILFSCQNAKRENEKYQTWQKVEFEKGTIYVSSQKMYSDSQIKLAGAFDKELKTVSVAFNNHMQASKSQPKDSNWEDTFSITQPTPNTKPLQNGKHKIAIVATPKDGSKSTTFEAEIEIISKPNVTFTYNRSEFKEQDIVAKSDVKLLGITMKTPDGKLIPFKGDPTGLSFTLKHAMPSPKDGKTMVIIQQEENLEFEMKLFMEDATKKRIYYFCYEIEQEQPIKYLIKSCSLDLEDEQIYCELPFPTYKDEFLEKAASFSYEKKIKSEYPLKPMTISPDKKWILYSTSSVIRFNYVAEDEKFKADYKIDGRQVNSINSIWFYVYNVQTGELKLINKPFNDISYTTKDRFFRQIIGYNYNALLWDKDNNLIMKEEYTDEAVYDINTANGEINIKIQSRIVKFDPNENTVVKTQVDDEIVKSTTEEPALMSYPKASGWNGYFQKGNLLHKVASKANILQSDIENQINKKLIKDYEYENYSVAMSIVNNKPYFLTTMIYRYAGGFSETGPFYPKIYKKALLDFETKKLSPLLKDDLENSFIPLDNLDMTIVSDDYPTYICQVYKIDLKEGSQPIGYQLIKIIDGKVVGIGSPKKIDGDLLAVR